MLIKFEIDRGEKCIDTIYYLDRKQRSAHDIKQKLIKEGYPNDIRVLREK